MTTADKEIRMTEIERLQRALAGAEIAAYEAPQGVNEWPHANAIRAKLHAAIEAAKTPEQRQIEALQSEVDRLQRKSDRLNAALHRSMQSNMELRDIIGLHTGKASDKAIGNLAMDLELIRVREDELAEAVRAGDLHRAQRICINRGLPRPQPKTLSDDLARIGLGRTA